jgi:hypothetical protein
VGADEDAAGADDEGCEQEHGADEAVEDGEGDAEGGARARWLGQCPGKARSTADGGSPLRCC